MSIKAGLHAPSHCSLFPGKFPQLAIPPETYHQWTCLHVLTACLSIQPLPCDNCSIFHQLQAAGALLSPHPFASLFLLPYRCVGHTHGPPSLLQVRNSSPSSPMPTAPNQMPYISLHSSSKLNTKKSMLPWWSAPKAHFLVYIKAPPMFSCQNELTDILCLLEVRSLCSPCGLSVSASKGIIILSGYLKKIKVDC